MFISELWGSEWAQSNLKAMACEYAGSDRRNVYNIYFFSICACI